MSEEKRAGTCLVFQSREKCSQARDHMVGDRIAETGVGVVIEVVAEDVDVVEEQLANGGIRKS